MAFVLAALVVVAAAALLARSRSAAFGGIGLVEAIEGNLARLRVNLEYLDLHHVAHGQYVLHLADAAVGHAGDVQQAVFARRQLDEGAEVLDAHDFAFIDFADLRLLDDAQDHGLGGLARRALDGSDVDGAVFLDVDLRPFHPGCRGQPCRRNR